MNNLDSLQNANTQLPAKAAGVRVPDAGSTQGQGADTSVRLLTPSGNALPPQAKPAPQSAIQRND